MPRINLQHIAQSHFVLVGVVALLLAACGSSHEVIYRCDGSADEVRAEYIGPDGAPTEETSGLPWQVTLSFSGDRVETDLTVTNLGDTGDVSCEVLIDNVSQFDTAGDRGVMITGTVERSGNTTRAQYSGGPILAEEPETEAEIAAGSGCDLGFGLGEECQVTTNDEWTPVIETFGGVDMALVPTGCFMMGSSEEEIDIACELRGDGLSGTGCDRDDFEDEKPQHEQCFDEPFWIDVTEVTNGQYGSEGGFSGDNRPRESVEWAEAEAHCQSRGARLPTEAEWEYAARGPDGLIFAWGDEFVPDNVVYGENSGGQTAAVGSNPGDASWVGALDMSGNVQEIVSSFYEDYPYDATDGREEGGFGKHVMRGGDWAIGFADRFRAARRGWILSGGGNNIGFRCARSY